MSFEHPTPSLTVVIPVFNERATIEQVLLRVQTVQIDKEIVIIDDCSTDGTREFLLMLVEYGRKFGGMILPQTRAWLGAKNISCYFQSENHGKGAAVRRGFREARGEIIVLQDADLELDPQDYFKLVEPIERQGADVVYGARFLNGRPPGEPLGSYMANRLLSLLSNLLTGLHLSDVWTGYKALRREVVEKLELQEERFGIEPELTAKITHSGYRIDEVSVSYHPRSRAEGKKIRLRDGFKGVWTTFRYNPVWLNARFGRSRFTSPKFGETLEGLNRPLAGPGVRSVDRRFDTGPLPRQF